LLSSLMKDPVRLPTSNMTVDRATIAQHLLNAEHGLFIVFDSLLFELTFCMV
jgi:hypothetical protein